MTELHEATALGAGTYVVEDIGPMRRYRRFIDSELRTLIYAGCRDVTAALADLKAVAAGVPAEVYSPVEPIGDGHRWRVTSVTPAGEVTRSLEREYSVMRDVLRENVLDPAGVVVHYTMYHYHDGALYELTTHAPGGTVTSRRDA